MGESNFIPKRLGEYREKEYWERRYQQDPGTYEWLLNYTNVKPLLVPHLQSTDRILNLGCGNSTLSEDLHGDGFEHVVNIDYSEAVIRAMQRRCSHMEWHVMDMRSLSLPDASFDVVLDKGSLDAVWTDGGSVWDPSPTVRADIAATVKEILRVLRPGGRFLSISFGQPHFRLPLLADPQQWEMTVSPIQDTFYFFYRAQKK